MCAFILKRVTNAYYKPEETIVAQGELADAMYFIANGKCEVIMMHNITGNEQWLKNLMPGDYFGEIGVIYETIRTCDVKTLEYSAVAALDTQAYKDCCLKYPQLDKKLKILAADYEDPWENFVMKAFQRVSYFTGLEEEQTNELMYSLSVDSYAAGDVVLYPGEPIPKLMIISKGSVRVEFKLDDTRA